VTIQFRRFDSGYKPFLYDLSYDGCKFMKTQKNVLVKTFYRTFQRNTNINHTCPYDVRNLFFKKQKKKTLLIIDFPARSYRG